MQWKNALPMVLVVIDVLSAIVYLLNKDYARAFYWLSAGCITASTMMM